MIAEINIKTVYLIGGFMVNDNFGDVIQAKVWVDFYHTQGIRVIYIHFEESKELIHKIFPDVNLLDFNLFTRQLQEKQLEKNALIHMYGGGYLNKIFGKIFLEYFKAFKGNENLMLITGVQLDKEFAGQYSEIFKYPSNIIWISFRDAKSRGILDKPSSIICDDCFGYFEKRQENRSNYNHLRIKRSKILLQLSLNEYMYREIPQNVQTQQILKDFFQKFERFNNKVIITSSFGDSVQKVLESKKLTDLLGVRKKFKYKSTMEINNEDRRISGYDLAIVNSFHTFIFCRFKLGCPTYMISMSDYYDQKIDSLREYGLIDEEHIIDNFENLVNIDLNQKDFSYPQKEFKIMFDRFDQVKIEVLHQLAKF
jgi:hypothetical protein